MVFLTSQFLYSQQKFRFHGNYTEAQKHPTFTIRQQQQQQQQHLFRISRLHTEFYNFLYKWTLADLNLSNLSSQIAIRLQITIYSIAFYSKSSR